MNSYEKSTTKYSSDENVFTVRNIFELSIFFYIFSIFFTYSSGDTLVKISRVAVVICFIFYYIVKSTKRKYKLKFRFYYIWGIAFVAYHLVIINTVAIDKSAATEFLFTFIYSFVVSAIIVYYLYNERNGIAKLLKWIPIFTMFGLLRLFLTYGFDYYFGGSRGEEVNGNSPGFYASFGCLIAFYDAVNSPPKTKRKYAYVLLTIINLILSVLTASRTVYVFLGVSMVCYIVFHSQNKLKAARNLIFAILFVVGIYMFLMNYKPLYNLVGYRIESAINGFGGGQTDASTKTRMGLIEKGVYWFSLKPIYGYGLDGFSVLNNYSYYAHNNYVEMLVDGGIIGFVLYYILHVYILIRGIFVFVKERNNYGVIFFVGSFVAYLISSYFWITYYPPVHNLWLIICYYITTKPLKKKNEGANGRLKSYAECY